MIIILVTSKVDKHNKKGFILSKFCNLLVGKQRILHIGYINKHLKGKQEIGLIFKMEK